MFEFRDADFEPPPLKRKRALDEFLDLEVSRIRDQEEKIQRKALLTDLSEQLDQELSKTGFNAALVCKRMLYFALQEQYIYPHRNPDKEYLRINVLHATAQWLLTISQGDISQKGYYLTDEPFGLSLFPRARSELFYITARSLRSVIVQYKDFLYGRRLYNENQPEELKIAQVKGHIPAKELYPTIAVRLQDARDQKYPLQYATEPFSGGYLVHMIQHVYLEYLPHWMFYYQLDCLLWPDAHLTEDEAEILALRYVALRINRSRALIDEIDLAGAGIPVNRMKEYTGKSIDLSKDMILREFVQFVIGYAYLLEWNLDRELETK